MNIYDFTCDFIKVAHNEFKCNVCGISISYGGIDQPVMICPKKIAHNNPEQFGIKFTQIAKEDRVVELSDKPQSFAEKVYNFTKEATSQAISGSPKCTDEQIQHRYNICTSCEFFKNNICTKCGCNLVREKIYMNKLAWADQSCPVGKWGPIEEPKE